MPKIGDWMIYRPSSGRAAPVLVKIESMEESEEPREAYGSERKDVTWRAIEDNRVSFCFSNGFWGYSDQVDIEDSKQAQQYMELPVEDVAASAGTLHPLIVEARLS